MMDINIEDPEVLAYLTRSGAIWQTPWDEQGAELVRNGTVPIEECENLPEEWRLEITGEEEPDNEEDAAWYAEDAVVDEPLYPEDEEAPLV